MSAPDDDPTVGDATGGAGVCLADRLRAAGEVAPVLRAKAPRRTVKLVGADGQVTRAITNVDLLDALAVRADIEITVVDKRPKVVRCVDCRAPVAVKPTGPLPRYCVECAKRRSLDAARDWHRLPIAERERRSRARIERLERAVQKRRNQWEQRSDRERKHDRDRQRKHDRDRKRASRARKKAEREAAKKDPS